jgi:hypothetical protein
MGDEVVNEDMRNNYPQLICNGNLKVQVPYATKYPTKEPKSCVACLSQVLTMPPLQSPRKVT